MSRGLFMASTSLAYLHPAAAPAANNHSPGTPGSNDGGTKPRPATKAPRTQFHLRHRGVSPVRKTATRTLTPAQPTPKPRPMTRQCVVPYLRVNASGDANAPSCIPGLSLMRLQSNQRRGSLRTTQAPTKKGLGYASSSSKAGAKMATGALCTTTPNKPTPKPSRMTDGLPKHAITQPESLLPSPMGKRSELELLKLPSQQHPRYRSACFATCAVAVRIAHALTTLRLTSSLRRTLSNSHSSSECGFRYPSNLFPVSLARDSGECSLPSPVPCLNFACEFYVAVKLRPLAPRLLLASMPQ